MDSPEAYNNPAMEPRIQYAKTEDGVTDIKGGKVKASHPCSGAR